MVCPKCGIELEDSAKFCPRCGTDLLQPQQPQPAEEDTAAPLPAQPEVPEAAEAPLSIGSYLIMFLLQLIPVVGLVLLFVWAFGSSTRGRKNYARAALLFSLILFVLSATFCIAFGAAFYSSAAGF